VKRLSYQARFKREVVKYAEEHGNRAAERHFDVNESCVRLWRRTRVKIFAMPDKQRAKRGSLPKWPMLEKGLKVWHESMRAKGRGVSTTLLCIKAEEMAEQMGVVDFTANPTWCFRFMKREHISVRVRTTMGQVLPEGWEKKVTDFQEFVISEMNGMLTRKGKLTRCQLGNMDEVPMTFDAPQSRTTEAVGTKSVKIVTTGNEKLSFTVVLGCMADGKKLRPMVIFKRVTKIKEKFPPGIQVEVNKKGWMNSDGPESPWTVWVNNCWQKRHNRVFKPDSLLIFDSMAAHKTDYAKGLLNNRKTFCAVIPGGLTCKVQPLDLVVNKVFKHHVRVEWEKWMLDGMKTFTLTGRMRRATYATVCEWVLSAWDKVKPETIIKAFDKACGPGLENSNMVDLTFEGEMDEEDEMTLASLREDDMTLATLREDLMGNFDSDCEEEDQDFLGFPSDYEDEEDY
jgi:hypothetical protein